MQTKFLICVELTLIILFGGIEAKSIRGGGISEGRTERVGRDGGGDVGAGQWLYL